MTSETTSLSSRCRELKLVERTYNRTFFYLSTNAVPLPSVP
jgi:hypothetical protein